MADWYYSDLWRQRQIGPVSAADLLAMNREGQIGAETRVWRQGMEKWESFRERAPEIFGPDDEGESPVLGVCAHSGRVLRRTEMIPYGDALIAIDARQEFVQSLMETGRTLVADATEKGVTYVGFWWRVLAILLDEMVKMVPNWIFSMIPPIAMLVMAGGGLEDSNTAGFLFAGSYFLSVLLTFGFTIFYETWMEGRYRATVGKMVIGAQVVRPDGSRLSYWRAFLRWLAKSPLGWTITTIPPLVIFVFLAIAMYAGFQDTDRPGIVIASFFFASVIAVLLTGVFSSVFWSAAFDPEKRALHDRIAATRVIKK